MIVAIGDTHGKFSELIWKLTQLNIENVSYVQVGDFGIGFSKLNDETKKLSELNDLLASTNSSMYVIRGNHDDPDMWNSHVFNFDRITLVKDNTILKIEGKWCLFAGGAPSIDKIDRIEGITWWADEVYEFSDPEIPAGCESLACVFTHDVYHPISAFNMSAPIVTSYLALDADLLEILSKSQQEMKSLYSWIESKFGVDNLDWYHGHYHKDTVTYNGTQTTHCIAPIGIKEVM